jgi:hypothetical protein
MDNSLRQLNAAIDARIAKEDEFIRRITQEFGRIKQALEAARAQNPQAGNILAPIIQQVDAASARVRDTDSFGTGDLSRNLFDRVVNGPGPRPPGPPAPSLLSGLFGSSPAVNGPGPRPPGPPATGLFSGLFPSPAPGTITVDPRVAARGPRPLPPGGPQSGGWKTKRSKRPKRTRRPL